MELKPTLTAQSMWTTSAAKIAAPRWTLGVMTASMSSLNFRARKIPLLSWHIPRMVLRAGIPAVALDRVVPVSFMSSFDKARQPVNVRSYGLLRRMPTANRIYGT